MNAEIEFDVAIVGFGPAGAIAACWLGQAGVKTLVVEKSRTIWEIPRAIALDHEILRVFQNIGVVEEVLPHTAPFGASEHYGAAGQLIRRIGVVPPLIRLAICLTWYSRSLPSRESCAQAEAHPSVTVDLGIEVTGLNEKEERVAVTIQDEAGREQVVKARYVIACDGASGTVRRLVNIALDDLGFDEPWLVVDVIVNDDAIAKLPRVARNIAIRAALHVHHRPGITVAGRSC